MPTEQEIANELRSAIAVLKADSTTNPMIIDFLEQKVLVDLDNPITPININDITIHKNWLQLGDWDFNVHRINVTNFKYVNIHNATANIHSNGTIYVFYITSAVSTLEAAFKEEYDNFITFIKNIDEDDHIKKTYVPIHGNFKFHASNSNNAPDLSLIND